MTEKRFLITDDGIVDLLTSRQFKKIKKNDSILDSISCANLIDVVNLLNELNDENKDLEEARSYYQENFLTMKTERNQLKEENEQLKQDIENLKITIKARETLIDVCEKKFKELGFIITVDDDGYVIE